MKDLRDRIKHLQDDTGDAPAVTKEEGVESPKPAEFELHQTVRKPERKLEHAGKRTDRILKLMD